MKNKFRKLNKNYRFYGLCVALALILGAGCSDRSHPAGEEETHADTAEHEGEEGVQFSPEQQERLGLELGEARMMNLSERIRVPASVELPPMGTATIKAGVEGVLIELAEGLAPGREVRQGEILGKIRPLVSAMDIGELEADYLKAKAAWEQSQTNYARIEKLFASGAKSQREWEEARLALSLAQADWEKALGWRSIYRGSSGEQAQSVPALELVSPLDGVVTSLAAGLGLHVSAGEELMTLANTNKLWISASIPQNQIQRIEDFSSAYYEVGPGNFVSTEGAALHRSPVLDPVSRMGRITWEVPADAGNLRAGQALHLYLAAGKAGEVLAVAESAVTEVAGESVVFVREGEAFFEKRPVRVGLRDGAWVEILSGLEAGETVVTRGAYVLKLAAGRSALPDPHAGHGH
jgi:cobalt-zinc-cadmium efflux system membrane fusion protein